MKTTKEEFKRIPNHTYYEEKVNGRWKRYFRPITLKELAQYSKNH